ncbi:hypothetical protein [Citrobacter farmeri]|uniref:hypothetical protein n=1 Tax=Citrobacter farmeri TaxID=67824 RepID=UPI002A7F958D|nr:hypothetical protein [Citrobacter farmeri]
MNNYHTDAVAGSAADPANIRAFLQQAIDHYPRLAAFSFTLALPYRETQADYRLLTLRFHTEVWQRMGEYSVATPAVVSEFTADTVTLDMGGGQRTRMQNGAVAQP